MENHQDRWLSGEKFYPDEVYQIGKSNMTSGYQRTIDGGFNVEIIELNVEFSMAMFDYRVI